MSAPEAVACRECHRDDQHKLSCSHVRYEGRRVIQPADEVAVSHEPPQPYCPGSEVACYYGGGTGRCSFTHGDCYYHHEDQP